MVERTRAGGNGGCGVSNGIIRKLPAVDEIIDAQEAFLDVSLAGYRNHVHRMINFCFAFGPLTPEQEEKIIVAGCFHDIGIWTAKTFDYLPPSIDASIEHLQKTGRSEWAGHISQMIGEHHKFHRFRDDPLTEVFRKGDLVDFSLGVIKCGIDAGFVKEVRSAFPNLGFHSGLVRLAGRWVRRHPFNPIPVLKW